MSEAAKTHNNFDYIIVGGGTAGCVLANRLSENEKIKILLLEAGNNTNFPWIHIPVGYLYCMGNPKVDWMMKTAKETGLNGRALNYPRGKVLGGCTSINGMIYMRGQVQDYNNWRELGNIGWGWNDLLPYFKKSESYYGGENASHGQSGEWKVAKQRLQWDILDQFREAALEFGIPKVDDFNDGTNFGSGFFDVNQTGGVRLNAAKAFLKPIKNRKNLHIITGAETKYVMLEGKAAIGVCYIKNGKQVNIAAKREVLLSAGAINSPKILELSGIGNPKILKDNGIKLQHSLVGVGENLQDHLQIRTVFKIKNAKTLNEMSHSIFGKAKMALEYVLKRSGPLSMAPSQLGIFTKSDSTQKTPNLEYHVQPLSTDKLGDPLHPYPAVTVSVCNLRPKSRGSSHIVSKDFQVHPKIKLNYLSNDEDKKIAVKSVKQIRALMKAKALKQFSPIEILPGVRVETDENILSIIGDIATTIFHPVGTCKMGNDDEAVVDHQLKVHGIKNLRVIDASIMPNIISGNTASPVIMIAEKVAEMIIKQRVKVS